MFNSPTAIAYQIVLGNNDDITSLVIDWTLESPLAAIGQPITKTFTATVSQNAIAPVTIDPLAPQWRRGRQLRLFLDGTLFATLRIVRFDYDEDDVSEANPRGELVAECCLARESFPRVTVPFGNSWFDGAERETVLPGLTRLILPWTLAVDRYLSLAGLNLYNADSLPILLSNTFVNGQLAIDGFTSEPPDPDNDPIVQAAAIALGSGYWLTTDEQDRVIAVPWPMGSTNASPLLRLSNEQVHKFTLQRLETGDTFEPPERVEVVGRTTEEPGQVDPATVEPVDPDDPNQSDELFREQPCAEAQYGSVELPGGGILQTFPPRISNGAAYFEEIKTAPVSVLFPDVSSGGTITEYRRIQRTLYDAQGKPLSSTTRLSQPLGLASSTLYPNNTTVQLTETIFETWGYRQVAAEGTILSGAWISYQRDTFKPRDIALNDANEPSTLTLANRTVTRYYERGCDQWTEITSDFELRRRPSDNVAVLTLVSSPEPRFLTTAPEPPYQPVLSSPEPRFWRQDVEILPADFVENVAQASRSSVISLPAVNSTERSQQIAQIFTELFQGRRWARIIERALDRATVENFRLFEIEDIINARFIRDGFAIASAGGITVCGYTGQFVGDLPTRITYPRQSVQVPLDELAIAPISAFALAVGQSITIPLFAVSGTSPYVFSADQLPDGLTIDGDRIIGVAETAQTIPVTVTVTDGDAGSDSTTFSIVVIASPVARRRYRVVQRVIANQEQSATWTEPPPPIEVIAEQQQSAIAGFVERVFVTADQRQGSIVAIAAAPFVVVANQRQSAQWFDRIISVDARQNQNSVVVVEDVNAPVVAGWVAHYSNVTTQLAIGNAAGTVWTPVALTNGFANSGSGDRQTTATSTDWVMALGQDTTDNNTRAITRAATNSDLTVPGNWTLHKVGLPLGGTINGLAWVQDSIWVASIGSQVYRSTNNGISWASVYTTPSGSLNQIAVNQATGTIVIPLSGSSRFARSTDSGVSWTTITISPSLFGGDNIRGIAWNGNRLAVGRANSIQPTMASTFNINADTGWITINTGVNVAVNHVNGLDGALQGNWVIALNSSTSSVIVSVNDLNTFTAYNLGFIANGSTSSNGVTIVALNNGRVARSLDLSTWAVTQAVTGNTSTFLSITPALTIP